ncbi:hypothetical protein COPG_00073 [Colwellia phage 9A]|uniref:Uncharacterized protein n=1 Tax=Colwellia phage 9A TaxID=765765 RepID=I3UMF4_9CAUD|nr:hypothetical protein COPG_00073 [Colwellia phage 9A]AFK66669.1 hypothetical protein COPG_00073 [Colwellia phage 9A]
MSDDVTDNNNSKKGFASFSPEKKEKALAKSVATRKRNKEEKAQKVLQATALRDKADKLIKQAEMLQQEADELDGKCSSDKSKKKKNAELVNAIDERFRDSVSAQYLKMMKQHAIKNNHSVDELTTPSFIAMDILMSPTASTKEKLEAQKLLQQFENAKPTLKPEEDTDVIGNKQEEFNKLMLSLDNASPKR